MWGTGHVGRAAQSGDSDIITWPWNESQPWPLETGFHYVDQAVLKLLTSNDSSTSASQSAGITGTSHCAWLPSLKSSSLEQLLEEHKPSLRIAPLCDYLINVSHLHQTRQGLSLLPRLVCSGTITAHCSLDFMGSSDPSASAFPVAWTTAACHHAQLIF
ncbi:Protein PPP5D1 [Plecturocebus cupreus]